jgi:5-methylcytosine-specific restriction endonuclease McrA
MPRPTNNRRGALRPGGRGGSTREWRRIRERILKRDNHECAYCGPPPSPRSTVTTHTSYV